MCRYLRFDSTARHMSSASLPSVSVTTSARLSPTTTTPSLSTPVITLQDSSIVDSSVADSSITASARQSPAPSLSTPAILFQDSSIADSSIAVSARLLLSTTTFSLNTPVIILQDSSIAEVSPSTLPQPSSRGGNMQFTDENFPATTVGIAAGVGGGFLLAMFIALVVIAVFLLVWRRKRKYSYSLPADHVVDNPLYDDQGTWKP